MSRIKFDNGMVVNFDGDPTMQDIEEVAQRLGISNNQPQAGVANSSTPSSLSPGGDLPKNKFLESVVDSTVGKKSVVGTVANVGNPVNAALSLNEANDINDSANSLRKTADFFLKRAQEETDPKRAAKLFLQAKTILSEAGVVGDMSKQTTQETAARTGQDVSLSQNLKNIGGTALNAALTATSFADPLAPKVISKVAPSMAKTQLVQKGANVVENIFASKPGLVNLAGRMAEGSAIAGGFNTASNLVNNKPITENLNTSLTLGAAIPLAGSVLSKSKELLGRMVKATGQKIQSSVIKPSIKDVKDGFDIANIEKYNLGGSLDQTLTKTNARLNDLNKQLADKLQGSNATVDLANVYAETAKSLAGKSKAENFGDIKQIKKVLDDLANEIEEVGTATPDLPTANIIKRAAGTKGAWQFGMFSPDAKASEVVYDTFYNKLKTAIEEAAPAGVKGINKEMAKLIPISNAVLRRIPVAERNGAISLTDAIGLFHTVSDPSVAPLVLVNKLSKSGRVGNVLSKTGSKLLKVNPSATTIGSKVFGK